MPDGFSDMVEAQLHNAPKLLDQGMGRQLSSWWLAQAIATLRTPNLDIASTCTIDGKQGFLLVEAKAHSSELRKEEAGKKLDAFASADSRENHLQIGLAISEAGADLSRTTNLHWAISRDRCYQMSNRFAWAWKLTQLGFRVILVYLGFLEASEMADRGVPLSSHLHWEALVISHGGDVVPPLAWGRQWQSSEGSITPLIRSVVQPLRFGS